MTKTVLAIPFTGIPFLAHYTHLTGTQGGLDLRPPLRTRATTNANAPYSPTAASATPKQYHVESLLREPLIPPVTPVSRELILCHIAERVLGLPKSY